MDKNPIKRYTRGLGLLGMEQCKDGEWCKFKEVQIIAKDAITIFDSQEIKLKDANNDIDSLKNELFSLTVKNNLLLIVTFLSLLANILQSLH